MSRWLTPNAGGGGIGSRVRGLRTTATANIADSESTRTAISFTAADEFDTDDWHDHTAGSPADTQFTVPTGKGGLYSIAINTRWSKASTTAPNITHLEVDGSIIASSSSLTLASGAAQATPRQSISEILELSAGQVITVTVTQESSTTSNVTRASITIVRLGDSV